MGIHTDMAEPFRSQFIELLQCGAGEQDIHSGAIAIAPREQRTVSPAFMQRELDRVATHLRGVVSLLAAHHIAAPRVLDVGCSTGGTTAAVALSSEIAANEVIGVDPNGLSIEAARVRANGLGLTDRVRFQQIQAGGALPFESQSFDLVIAVSVLEFIPSAAGRRAFLSELCRVTRPGGYIYLATPCRWRLRELHTDRWLGNFLHHRDEPWASGSAFITRALDDCHPVNVRRWLAGELMRRLGRHQLPAPVQSVLARLLRLAPWQKHLFVRGASLVSR